MNNNKKFFNPPARIALYCWMGALGGIAVFLYPLIFPIEAYGLGFALNFFGIIIFLTGLISGIVFNNLAKKLDKLVNGEGLLAHWTYSSEEWSRYTEAEHIRDRREKWGLFCLIAVIAAIVGVVFSIITRDSWLITLIIVAGLIVLIAVVAYFSIAWSYKQNRVHPGEVYIGKSGALLGHTFHYWKLPGSFLHSVDFREGDPPFIELVYSSQSGQVRGQYTAGIPVPQGHEAEAKEVLTRLSGEQTGI